MRRIWGWLVRWGNDFHFSLFVFLVASAFHFGAWSSLAYAEAAKVSPKDVMSPSFWVGTVVVAFLVISGVEALLKSKGVIKSPADESIARMERALSRIMPENVSFDETSLGRLFSRAEAILKRTGEVEVEQRKANELLKILNENLKELNVIIREQLDPRIIDSMPHHLQKIEELNGYVTVGLQKLAKLMQVQINMQKGEGKALFSLDQQVNNILEDDDG